MSVLSLWVWFKPTFLLSHNPVGSDHSLFTGWFLVKPTPLSLFARGGVAVTVMLAIVFLPTGWIQERHPGADAPDLAWKLQTSLAIPLFWLITMFAATDRQAAAIDPSKCFSVHGQTRGPLTAVDALYFTVGNFTTAGTGSLTPESPTCRAMVAYQTGIGAVAILLGVAGVLWRITQHRAVSGTASGVYGGQISFDDLHTICAESSPSDWGLIPLSQVSLSPDAASHAYRAVYLADVSIVIEWGLPQDDSFEAPWLDCLVSPPASSHWLDLCYNGVLVQRSLRIHIENGPPCGLPAPWVDVGASATETSYRIARWTYDFFAIVDQLEHGSDSWFETYMNLVPIEVVD